MESTSSAHVDQLAKAEVGRSKMTPHRPSVRVKDYPLTAYSITLQRLAGSV